MKKLWLLLCFFVLDVPAVWACVGAGPGRGQYEIQGGQVFYQSYRQNNRMTVEEADVASLISIDEYSSGAYARMFAEHGIDPPSRDRNKPWYFTDYVSDKNYVYYQGQVLEGVNPLQVVFLRQRFDEMVLIDGLKQYFPNDEWYRADGYLKDDERVFYNGRLLEGARAAHFDWLALYGRKQGVSSDFARDDQHIYMYGQKVAGNPATAYEIDYGYYLDDQHIYFRGDVLEGALPDDFELRGVFIISDGQVYYRAEQLALDAASFQVLKYIEGSPVIGCGGTTYGGSFVQDQYGVYVLDVAGALTRLHEIKEDDLNGQTVYIYKEIVSPASGAASIFYTDGHTHYFFSNTTKDSGTLESLFAGDSATFTTYAALARRIVFHDQTGIYISGRYYGQPLTKVMSGQVTLMCLETDHLCLLINDVLYYIFDDGTVEQIQVSGKDLQCVQSDELLSSALAANTSQGMCFDRDYFYNRGTRQNMYAGGYEEALTHTITANGLEERRLESIRTIKVERKSLLIEENANEASFGRTYYM